MLASVPRGRLVLVLLVLALSAATSCRTGPQPPATMSQADVRLQLFDHLSAFAGSGGQRQAVLFLFADEKHWVYRYLGGREWSITMPAEANGEQLLDEAAEWRLDEATGVVRPANQGAQHLIEVLRQLS